MGVERHIDITAEQQKTILTLLEQHLPGTTAWAYGSRAKWTSRPQSDLDLVVFATSKQRRQVDNLREAFEESDLPFRVDLFVWDDVPEEFHEQIEQDYVVLVAGRDGICGISCRSAGSAWPLVRFEHLLAEPVRNGVYKKKEFHGQGVKMINMGELFAYPRLRAVPMKRVELSETEADRFLVRKGDLLFARRSLVSEGAGKCCAILEVDEPTAFESSIIRARPDSRKVDQLYLFYFFDSPAGLHLLDTIRRQVAVAGITGSDLAGLPIPVPPLSEQRAIAHILGTLDDKIELNRRMNETLEAMARAIFKDWFIDFGPTRAKAEGRYPYLPPEIWKLFPDTLVDSELGKIPEGWKVKALGDRLAELVSGSRPRGGAVETGVPSIGAENIVGLGQYDFSKDKYVPIEFFARLKNKGAAVRGGDVLLYKDGAQIGRKTYFDCGFPHSECAVNEHVFILRLRQPEAQRYLFFWLDQIWMTEEIISLNSNSAQPGINQAGVRSLLFLVPADDVLAVFNNIVGPLTDSIFTNCHESRAITAIRDTLLPKLMTGELRVRD